MARSKEAAVMGTATSNAAGVSLGTQAFTGDEVAFILQTTEDITERVYALLSGVRAMLPLDGQGEPDDPAMATLLQMAMNELDKFNVLNPCWDKLPPELRK